MAGTFVAAHPVHMLYVPLRSKFFPNRPQPYDEIISYHSNHRADDYNNIERANDIFQFGAWYFHGFSMGKAHGEIFRDNTVAFAAGSAAVADVHAGAGVTGGQ